MDGIRHKNQREGKKRRMKGNDKVQKVESCVKGRERTEDEGNKWWIVC